MPVHEHKMPLILAHRGAAGDHPENSREAFDAAIAQGADGIECDIRISADGVPVILHDPWLNRTTNGSGFARNMRMAELRTFRLTNGERLLTLEEMLDRYAVHCLLLLEFKDIEAVPPAMELITGLGNDAVKTCSFHPGAVALSRRKRADIDSCLITGSFDPNPFVRWRENFPCGTMARIDATGLSCHFRMLNNRCIGEQRGLGRSVFVWSCMFDENQALEWQQRALPYMPDALITAWPERMRKLVMRSFVDKAPAHISPETEIPQSA